MEKRIAELRVSLAAEAIRARRLIVVLRRISPQERLLELIVEHAAAGAEVFEITFDTPSAAADLAACRERLEAEGHDGALVGAGTIRTRQQLEAADEAGAAFVVSPVFDPEILAYGLEAGLPTIPGAYTPTEVDRAWRAGATFVKLFPASSLGPAHVRELRGPLGEVELIPTGGIDASNARAYLDAGATAVGIGSAFSRATAEERRTIVAATRAGN